MINGDMHVYKATYNQFHYSSPTQFWGRRRVSRFIVKTHMAKGIVGGTLTIIKIFSCKDCEKIKGRMILHKENLN